MGNRERRESARVYRIDVPDNGAGPARLEKGRDSGDNDADMFEAEPGVE